MSLQIHWLAQQAQTARERIALVHHTSSWTFAQWHQWVRRRAAILQHLHLSHQRCAVLSHNDPDLLCLIYALSYITAPVIVLNHRLSAMELAQQLIDIEVTCLLYDVAHTQLALDTSQQLDNARNNASINLLSITELRKLEQKETDSSPDLISLDPEDVFLDLTAMQGIFCTSGTSGKPKAVPLTYGNHWHSAQATAAHLGINQQDCWLLCLPLCHVGGLSILWRSVILGHGIVLLPSFSVAAVFQALATTKVTVISLVPTLLFRLLTDPALPHYLSYLQNLKCILLGGAALDPQLWQRCQELKIPICPTYGMTEAASQITTLLPHELANKFGSSGRPLPCTQIEIRDLHSENAKKLMPFVAGEIYLKGHNIFGGYLGRQDLATSQIKTNLGMNLDQWFATGDIGYLDDHGYLYVLNRRHDLIISGGENIYPVEIEAVLLRHGAISEACVIGVDHPEWGQQVTAVVVTQTALNLLEIQRFCELAGLGRYKLPRKLFCWDNLPKTASGKIARQIVKKMVDDISLM